MTVQANISRWQYNGNGVATSFDYNAKVFAKTDLVVTRSDALGVNTVLVVDVDYTVSGVGDDDGGAVIYPISGSPLPVLEKLTIERLLPITQLLDLRNQGAWLPENHEDAYDRLTMIAQQFDDALERSLRYPATDLVGVTAVLPSRAERANKVLAFDSLGHPIASGGTVSGAIPVSVFMETMLDDANAAAAMTTLGISAFVQTILNDADAATVRATIAAMQQVLTTRGDIVVAGVGGVPERLAIGTTEQVLYSTSVVPNWGIPVPDGYRSGLELSRASALQVTVAFGVAKSTANTNSIRLGNPMTKRLDAVWASGTGQGGRPAAVSLTGSTWYHVFVIFNAATGLSDAGFDTSANAANLLAASGFTVFRRIGSVLTNAGATDIEDWLQTGNHFFWKSYPSSFNSTVGAGSNIPLHVPPDVKPLAWINLVVEDDVGDSVVLVASPDSASMVPSDSGAPYGSLRADGSVNGPFIGQVGPVRVDAIRQVFVRASVVATPVRIATIGWFDPLS